jgi:hypothetical protein
MKVSDILFKIFLFGKIDRDEDISIYIPIDIKIGYTLRYINVIMYPSMFLFAI